LERLEDATQVLKEMPEISDVTNVNGDGALLHAEFAGDDRALQRILATLITRDIPVVSFAPRSSGGRLEEIFMNITEGGSLS